MGFTGNFEDHFLETVSDPGLIVVELDDVGVFLCQYAGNVEELTRFIRQRHSKAENAATGNQGLFNQGGDHGDVDIAAADYGSNLPILKWQFGERG